MGDFTLAVNPASQTVSAGSSTSFTVNIQGVGSFNQPVGLSAVLSPPESNIRLAFSSTTVTPGGNATLTVTTAANQSTSTFSIAITGTAGQLARNQTVMLNVVGSPNPGPVIAVATFNKPILSINGTSFGSSAKVNINGQDVSARITSQSDTLIMLKGNKKKLNLKKGQNQVTVIAGGATSNIFVLNL
jgi:hypothetical protein